MIGAFLFLSSVRFHVSYKKLLSLLVGSQEYLPCSSCDFSIQSVHQRCDQSLLVVVGGEDQQHGVPGQTLKTGDTVGLSGEERVMEDHSLLDTSEGPQLVQDQFILSDLLLFAILTFLHNQIIKTCLTHITSQR